MNYNKEINKTNVEFGDMPPQAFLLGLLSAFDNRYQAAADEFQIPCRKITEERDTCLNSF